MNLKSLLFWRKLQREGDSDTIELVVRARDFINKDFGDATRCPLATAAKLQFNTSSVSEVFDHIKINKDFFNHEHYGQSLYSKDLAKAKSRNFDDTVIRTIKLSPAENDEYPWG